MKTMILLVGLLTSSAALAAPFGGRGEQRREGDRFARVERNEFRRDGDRRREEGRHGHRHEARRDCGKSRFSFHNGRHHR